MHIWCSILEKKRTCLIVTDHHHVSRVITTSRVATCVACGNRLAISVGEIGGRFRRISGKLTGIALIEGYSSELGLCPNGRMLRQKTEIMEKGILYPKFSKIRQ
jgi:hypothetical protein